MTARKHLKHLVRERMRKTGERYTVARRHVVAAAEDSSWELRGGLYPETAAFANVLANLGVEPPLSEAMVLGVGGGLGAGYILWEFEAHGYRALTLGFSRLWQYPARWAAGTAERLGLHAEIHETGGTKAAAAALDAQLERGLPVIVWIDSYRLGYRHEPAHRDGHGGPPLVVYARAGERYLIDDRSSGRVSVSADALSAARARVVSFKNRLIAIDPERIDLDRDRLRAAVEEGIRLQIEHLSAKSDSFSLPAWRKWARMTTDTSHKKGWPNVFADGRGIATMRASLYTQTARGAHLRGLYAEFLDEASDLLARPALRDASAAWRAAAEIWDAIADTALPPGDELRELIDRSEAAISRGDSAAAALAAARWELQARRDEAGELPDVGDQVAAVYAAEVAALARLRDVAA
jgi:hypothetical protein